MDRKNQIYLRKRNREISQIAANQSAELEKLKESHAKNGTLNSGGYTSSFVDFKIKKVEEKLLIIYRNYREIILDGSIDTDKKVKDIIIEIESGKENTIRGFKDLLGRQYSLINKEWALEEFKRKYSAVLGKIKSEIEIEYLENQQSNQRQFNHSKNIERNSGGQLMRGKRGQAEITEDRPMTMTELIKRGESATMEFKSTLQWDVKRKQKSEVLRFAVLKSISAFLNSEGGILFIGVEDNGDIYGVEKDIDLVKGKSIDGFEKTLMDLISEYIGAEFSRQIKVDFDLLDKKNICQVTVDKASKPNYMKGPQRKEFYIRTGNTTRSLDIEKATTYIQDHWK